MEEENKKEKLLRSAILTKGTFDPKTYEYDSSFKPWDGSDHMGVHTTHEMMEALAADPKIELDARVLHVRKYEDGRTAVTPHKVSKSSFMESFAKDVGRGIKVRKGSGKTIELREGFGGGGFGSGTFSNGSLGNTLVGSDFTPLLGGPFYKNLYFYQDYIRMHAEAFYSYNNDPFGRAIIQIKKNFVLGTGYEVQCDLNDRTGQIAMAAWRAFEEANDLPTQIDQLTDEIALYGEVMVWELPGQNTKITYRLSPTDTRPLGIIPRVRLIDPSNIVEVVTYPEDITRPLFYVWLQPTQYQIFTGGLQSGSAGVTNIQPTSKFIYRQIPAEEMLHFKVNCMSNEKRGRSDLFPVFNYLKRLRDAVNYQMIGLEKISAWSLDTTVEGDQTDIDAYIQDQRALGTIPPPGSEFVHSKGITRQYLGNKEASAHSSDVLSWCLSCIAAGSTIPVSWFGVHLSGGQTRASALVGTEPVAKSMEHRREVLKRIIKRLWKLCMDRAGIPNVQCDIVLPELMTQDRSQKLKDIAFAEQNRWIKPERAASLAAKELGVQQYDYNEELKDIKTQLPEIPMPLIDPGAPGQLLDAPAPDATPSSGGTPAAAGGSLAPPKQQQEAPFKAGGALTSQDKVGIKKDDTTL